MTRAFSLCAMRFSFILRTSKYFLSPVSKRTPPSNDLQERRINSPSLRGGIIIPSPPTENRPRKAFFFPSPPPPPPNRCKLFSDARRPPPEGRDPPLSRGESPLLPPKRFGLEGFPLPRLVSQSLERQYAHPPFSERYLNFSLPSLSPSADMTPPFFSLVFFGEVALLKVGFFFFLPLLFGGGASLLNFY